MATAINPQKQIICLENSQYALSVKIVHNSIRKLRRNIREPVKKLKRFVLEISVFVYFALLSPALCTQLREILESFERK